tara:strand:- start:351 stop:956 length:606 start_codon:yes stop_codon:yes gene_type:complete
MNERSKMNEKMELDEAIISLNVNINEHLRTQLISYIDHKAIKPLRVAASDTEGNGEGELNLDIRKVNGHTLNNNYVADKIYFKHIMELIHTFVPNYNVKFKHQFGRKLTQVDLLKYKPGGKYTIHVDHDLSSTRTLSCIINLNDEYKGGDFVFYHPVTNKEYKRIKCQKGTMIFFPSNFLFPHSIEPLTKGTRYSIVSWIL